MKVPRPLVWLSWAAALVLLVVHVIASYTLNVNGDELGLIDRAVRTLMSGTIQTGGRPGLGTLAVIPIARDCVDTVRAVVEGRVLWTLFVVGGIAGFLLLLREYLPEDRNRSLVLGTALGLWVLAPPFLQYSIQLRTDQPAICFAIWSGVALLASQRRAWLAIPAGALFGIGFLFSQKAAYVGALVGVLVLGRLAVTGDWNVRRELGRAGLLAAGSLFVVALYRGLISLGGEPPELMALSDNLASRAFYQEMFGFRYFRYMLPALLPQVIALGCVAIATIDWFKTRDEDGAQILTAWGVVAVGTIVFLFHTTRAPYFFLVMGLFPAVAGGLVLGPIRDRLKTDRERRVLFAVLWVPLVIGAGLRVPELLRDTQRPQRDALAFVERNFPAEAQGFQAYSLFMCREDPDPFFFANYRVSANRFAGPNAERYTREILDAFRAKPVSFMILPTPTQPFPTELWDFWLLNYEHYAHHVQVPGAALNARSTPRSWDVFVEGTYRWYSETGSPLTVDDRRIEPGATVDLSSGVHRLDLPDGGGGRLLYDLADPPSDPPELPLFQPWPSPAANLEEDGG